MPGQEHGTGLADPVAVALEAARLYGLDPRQAIAVVLLAGDDLRVALAAIRVLSACLEGLDRVNGG